MSAGEPASTAILLFTVALLLGGSVLVSRAATRVGVPAALPFLFLGIVAGVLGLGGAATGNYALAYRLGTVALVLILYDGGLNTSYAVVQQAAAPAGVLATLGVLVTAAVTAVGAHAFGFPWRVAFLLGAVTSSTDAAAVFSVLRASGVHLKRRVAATLELESGLNDPMAVVLTIATTELLARDAPAGWHIAGELALQLGLGAVIGLAVGGGGKMALSRARLPTHGLYPVLTTSLALAAYGLATINGGSGFLAVYVCGVVVGNGHVPYRAGTLRVHDALAWFAQIGMFLVLGLMASPSRLRPVVPVGVGIAFVLAFIARPVAVAACLAPFRYRWKEILYVGWVGLRGAVPVVLATIPVLAGVDGAERIFDVVFFVVVAGALVPGGTVRRVTRALGLEANVPPTPKAMLELVSRLPLDGELVSFYIDRAVAACGASLADVPLPDGSAVTLVVRGESLLAPSPSLVLTPGDHVYVVCKRDDRPMVQLMFGRPEEE